MQLCVQPVPSGQPGCGFPLPPVAFACGCIGVMGGAAVAQAKPASSIRQVFRFPPPDHVHTVPSILDSHASMSLGRGVGAPAGSPSGALAGGIGHGDGPEPEPMGRERCRPSSTCPSSRHPWPLAPPPQQPPGARHPLQQAHQPVRGHARSRIHGGHGRVEGGGVSSRRSPSGSSAGSAAGPQGCRGQPLRAQAYCWWPPSTQA